MKRNVLTIGNFDGVHLGHQAILKKVRESARRSKGTSVVYTFSPHPAKVMAPNARIKLIQTNEQKLRSIEKAGIDRVVVERFTKKFSHISPDDFFRNVIIKKFHPVKIIVGYDLTFGRHRTGSVELLEQLCMAHGIEIEVVNPVFLKEVLISSTQIRLYLSGGFVQDAARLMGRPYSIEGKVVRGKGLGGEIGIHTANLSTLNELMLPEGVYITRTLGHMSVTNIGRNPTFGQGPLTIETHIMNFDKKIYGRTIEVEFHKKLRDEIQFTGPKALQEQIAIDIMHAKRYFKGREHAKKRP